MAARSGSLLGRGDRQQSLRGSRTTHSVDSLLPFSRVKLKAT
jgi:hypothetical protein